jgi:acetoacetate decarboxylase
MPVTGDMAMAGGREQFGFPKKIAQQIQLNQSNDEIQGFVERNGVRFFELKFTPDEQAVDENIKAIILQGFGFGQDTGAATYLYKCFKAPDSPLFDYPPRLIRQTTVFRPKTIEWGQVQIKMTPSECDPWDEVEVVSPIGALRIVGDNTMMSGQVLAEVDQWVAHAQQVGLVNVGLYAVEPGRELKRAVIPVSFSVKDPASCMTSKVR